MSVPVCIMRKFSKLFSHIYWKLGNGKAYQTSEAIILPALRGRKYWAICMSNKEFQGSLLLQIVITNRFVSYKFKQFQLAA